MKNIFKIEEDGTVKRKSGSAEEVFKAFGLDEKRELKLTSVIRWMKQLKTLPCSQSIRGKYDLWIFRNSIVVFVKKAIKEKKCPYKIRIRNSLSGEGFIESLAGRVPIPKYISEFLDNAIP